MNTVSEQAEIQNKIPKFGDDMPHMLVIEGNRDVSVFEKYAPNCFSLDSTFKISRNSNY